MEENKKKPTVEDYNNANTTKFNPKSTDVLKEKKDEPVFVRKQKPKKDYKRKVLAAVLIILLIVVILLGLKKYEQYQLSVANEELNQYTSLDLTTNINEDISQAILTNDMALDTYVDKAIGYVQIPAVDMKVPVYQAASGEEKDMQNVMHHTAAHDPTTYLPGEDEKVVLTGHREEQFGKLQYVKKGDLVVVTIGENIFLYEVDEFKIVDADDQEAINYVYGLNGEDELVLYTCYPFKKFAPVKQRYVVHAKKISSFEGPIEVRETKIKKD